MRVGVKIGLGLSALVALSAPVSAKECVEPYGELVQVSEFEMAVRVKPECEAMQRAAIAARTGEKPAEISLGSSMVLGEITKSKTSLIPALPDTGELAVSRRPAKRTVSCSDPAVCGRSRVAAVVEKSFDCEDGRGYPRRHFSGSDRGSHRRPVPASHEPEGPGLDVGRAECVGARLGAGPKSRAEVTDTSRARQL